MEEHWDVERQQLSGVSRVVGQDPYELRLLLTSPPPASSAWRAKRVVLTAEDASAGVTAEPDELRDLALVRIQSPVSRTVHWVVEFEQERH